jgi:hypothetical protein
MDTVAHADRRALAEREGFSYAACAGLVRKTWKCQHDRPDRAIRTILATLDRWIGSCDRIADPDIDQAPPSPTDRWRLTPKGRAVAEALSAGDGRTARPVQLEALR